MSTSEKDISFCRLLYGMELRTSGQHDKALASDLELQLEVGLG